MKGFEYKCICDWSKNDEYGFIPNTECPVHGKATREMLKKTLPEKTKDALNVTEVAEWNQLLRKD